MICLIFIIYTAGCSSLQVKYNNVWYDFDEFFIKKKNYIQYIYCNNPEFYDLKDKISKQEYRQLQSYLQDCYEKAGKNKNG